MKKKLIFRFEWMQTCWKVHGLSDLQYLQKVFKRTHVIIGEILIHIQMKLGKKNSPNSSHVHLE